MRKKLISVLLVIYFFASFSGANDVNGGLHDDDAMVRLAAKKIGEEMWNLANLLTKPTELRESFSTLKVVKKNGAKILEEIAKELKAFTDSRTEALKRIVETAEKLPPRNQSETKRNLDEYKRHKYDFINTRNRDFYCDLFNTSAMCTKQIKEDDGEQCLSFLKEDLHRSKEASVFFPIDVFDREPNISMIVQRSKGLDEAFIANHKADPTIGWQFFCNASGLFRHYPASNWSFYPINNYDCRMRNWYASGSSSAKDVIILIEKAGSMEGKRLLIAIDVAQNILDTLTPNDFFNVFAFSEKLEQIINCSGSLVQATTANIFEYKQSLKFISTDKQTDLAEALEGSFKILENQRKSAACCNQVIFLITDGMEYNQTIIDLFEKHNWKKKYPVRVFSFLIGEQIPVTDVEQVKIMACMNKGYYVQIDTKHEAREQVLKYLPVMGRPLALHGTQNPVTWTSVYTDIMDTYRITNTDWKCKQGATQQEIASKYLKNYYNAYYTDIDTDIDEDADDKTDDVDYRKYVFMTTIAMPAYEKDNSFDLMGVAGIDVPIYEFERRLHHFHLGVECYAFIIDQNGQCLTHPDFRPFFQEDIIKPAYNSLDMTEVEMADDGREAREFNHTLKLIRELIIKQKKSEIISKTLAVKMHYDDMHRALRLKRNYFWTQIGQTSFSLVVTIAENCPNVLQVTDSNIVESTFSKGSVNVTKYFENFKLHPDWIYCRSKRKYFEDMKLGVVDPDGYMNSAEEDLIQFLDEFKDNEWNPKSFTCNQKLMQALINDAKALENFPSAIVKKSKVHEIIDDCGVSILFVATHSGLLKYKIFEKQCCGNYNENFVTNNSRSINEPWYRHSVDYNQHEPKSFIYSVPFMASEEEDTRNIHVLASHTISIIEHDKSAPVAVVGFKFALSKLEELMNENCPEGHNSKCYIVDDHAYILVSPHLEHVGIFLGRVENYVMQILVEELIYIPVKVIDYQAVCYIDKNITYELTYKNVPLKSSSAYGLKDPLKYLKTILLLLWNLPIQVSSYMANLMYPDPAHYYNEAENRKYHCPMKFCEDDENKDSSCNKQRLEYYLKCHNEYGAGYILSRHINKTTPKRCDKFSIVYSLNRTEKGFDRPFDECNRPFLIHKIPHSNLILLKIDHNCQHRFMTNQEFYDKPTNVSYPKYKRFNASEQFCQRLDNKLYRKASKVCYNHHEREPTDDREICGSGVMLRVNYAISIIILLSKWLLN